MLTRLLLAALAFSPATGVLAQSPDWPQWRGPNRDGHAAPQSLLQSWSEGGPQLKWTHRDAGEGYSAMAVAGNRVYTLGAKAGKEKQKQCVVICLDSSSGDPLWETAISRASTGDDYTHNWGGGPRSTPTVDGDFLYALSDVGVLACLRTDGELLWQVDLVEAFGGSIPNWGYSESPLVDGDRVIVTPGGANFMVGLDKRTGEQVWGSKGFEAPAEYVSVVRQEVGGVPMYITASKPGLVAFHADSGAKLWDNVSTGNNVAVIPTPVPVGDTLYHTSDYGAGNVKLQLTASGDAVSAKEIFFEQNKSMQNHHGGVVLVDGVIYGHSKVERGVWMAQDFETGETLWSEPSRPNRSGSIAYADGRLYCYNDDEGTVLLVEPSREQMLQRGKLQLPEQTEIPRGSGAIWAHPVIAGGTLLLRDQDLIFAFDIAR